MLPAGSPDPDAPDPDAPGPAGPDIPDAAGWVRLVPLSAIGTRPMAASYEDTPLVVWQFRGRVAVFVDRCPHQDFPLSTGRRTLRGRLQCEGHGWEFRLDGTCAKAPHRTPDQLVGRRATVVPSRVWDGWVEILPPPEASMTWRSQ